MMKIKLLLSAVALLISTQTFAKVGVTSFCENPLAGTLMIDPTIAVLFEVNKPETNKLNMLWVLNRVHQNLRDNSMTEPSFIVNPKDDFISNMFVELEGSKAQKNLKELKSISKKADKEKFVTKVLTEAMSAKSTEDLVQAFNFLYFAPADLSNHIIKILEKKMDTLPSIFFIMLAVKVAPSDLKKAVKYHQFAIQSSLIDTTFVKDKSVVPAVEYLNFPFISNFIVASISQYTRDIRGLVNDEIFQDIRLSYRKAFIEDLNNNFKAFKKIINKRMKAPHGWIGNHGIIHTQHLLDPKKNKDVVITKTSDTWSKVLADYAKEIKKIKA